MTAKKVPSEDGVLIEFYLAIWDHVGPILLEVLKMGLELGLLHPQLTKSIFILLEKGGPITIQ